MFSLAMTPAASVGAVDRTVGPDQFLEAVGEALRRFAGVLHRQLDQAELAVGLAYLEETAADGRVAAVDRGDDKGELHVLFTECSNRAGQHRGCSCPAGPPR